jgi:hypothetical protein
MLHDLSLSVFQLLHDLVMDSLLLTEFLNFFTCLLQRLDNLLISLLLIHLLLLLTGVFLLCVRKFILQLFDNVKVSVGNLLVIVLNVSILFGMLLC